MEIESEEARPSATDLEITDETMISDGYQNDGYQKEDLSGVMPSTSNTKESPPPAYKEKEAIRQAGDGIEVTQTDNEEEKILNVLREIVRKCTLANPLKRPTAREVLKMLEEVAPKELLADKFNISDDEDDEVKKLQ